MSGTNPSQQQLDLVQLQDKLFAVLDRALPVDPLESLIFAISPGVKRKAPLKPSAIGIDSNVFLRLGGHSKIVDIIDYLNSEHEGPIVLAGQTVQEFWNNQLAAVETMATSVTKKFDAFKADATKLSNEFADYAERMNGLIADFNTEFGHVYEESTVRSTLSLLQTLNDKAVVSHVPRMRFQAMAEQRKRAKTPPGFRDDGDGDFYVWIDFLFGLQQAQARGRQFTNVILLTHDKKPDWSRRGLPHPVLVAEVKALLGCTFELWTIEDLHRAIVEQ